jgi:ATP-dependent RNA helicase RhlE
VRSLERFIGRGLVRKRAEGFDYRAPAPPKQPLPQSSRPGAAPSQHGRPRATSFHPRRPQPGGNRRPRR